MLGQFEDFSNITQGLGQLITIQASLLDADGFVLVSLVGCALISCKLCQHFRHVLGRLIALLDHATDHREKGFVQCLASSGHLLGNFFTIGIGLNQFL